MANRIKIFLLITLFMILFTGLQIFGPLSLSRPAHGQESYIYHFPLWLNQDPRPVSTSYYVTTLNSEFLFSLGCQQGTRDKNASEAQNSVAVLAFGYPRCFNSGGYGANLFGYGPASTSEVSNAVKQFALGYYACTGSDDQSNLVIGVGTSNYRGPSELCDTLAKSTAHGTAWSGMVRDLNQWALAQCIIHQVQFYGANDIEVGWNSAAWSRAWVTGFDQVSGNFMLHFGDAAGCPYEDEPHWSCGSYSYKDWTMEDVWFVSYGSPSALPLPLIYLTNGVHAKQWAYLSHYSLVQHGYRMNFTGVSTQWQVCQQSGGCDGIDNTPDMAYWQLSHELNKNPATAQDLAWKTDIRWIYQSEIPGASHTQDMLQDEISPHPARQAADSLEQALQLPAINADLRTSLEAKQNAYQTIADWVAISQSQPAQKSQISPLPAADSPLPVFTSGIIERGEMPGLPYGARINHLWQAVTDRGYLQIGAGSAPNHSTQGAVYIRLAAPDQMDIQSAYIEAPPSCGPLFILDESDGLLWIQSSDGCQFTLDSFDWALTQSLN